jgi:hypothetical protein
MKQKERQDSVGSDSASTEPARLSWEEAYQEMATDAAEQFEWSDWDVLDGDGLKYIASLPDMCN